MASALCYRQRIEKSTGGEMVLMLWSPTMDLLAAVFKDHSVVLNRLSWQRVWSVPATDSAVTALAWRPDGKVLAIGRLDGSVCLYSVEDGHILHQFSAGAAITDLRWTRQTRDGNTRAAQYEEHWKKFLPPLPALDASLQGSFADKYKDGDGEDKHPSDPKQLATISKSLNLLLAGDEVGRVHVCVSGVFLAATMETKSDEESGHMMLTWMSLDLKTASSLVLKQSGEEAKLYLHTLNTSLLEQRSDELQHLAFKFGLVGSLLEYMSATLTAMHEAWEDVLVMMDTKLASYSKTLPSGQSVSDELLILLACGKARPELQTFLVDELTAKGLKKLGLSLEHSYINIRKYALSNLNSAIQSLQFHLGEVLGMARWYERFGILGLTEASIQECINSLGTFAFKSQEMLLAIDSSLRSIKVFFQWLYVVIHKLSDEPIPAGLKEHLTPEELKLMIEFLRKRLSKSSQGGSQSFNLEVVGQYLTDEDLKYTEERPPSLWFKTLQDANLDPHDIPWLFQPEPQKSLVQLFQALHKRIDTAFAKPMSSIQQSFCVELELQLAAFNIRDGSLHKTAKDGPLHKTAKDGSLQNAAVELQPLIGHFVFEGRCYVFFPSDEDIAVVGYGTPNESARCAKLYVSEVPSLTDLHHETTNKPKCEMLSLQCYSDKALSVLFRYPTFLVDTPSHAVAQISIEGVVSLLTTTITADDISSTLSSSRTATDVGPSLSQVLSLGHFKAGALAVTGSRQLAAALSWNGKKVRLFDVDADEEIEDEDDEDL